MRLKSLAMFAVAAGLLGFNAGAWADDYPNRSVKIIIAFSPSGAIDILGRFIADKLSLMWGQSVVVLNRPGGSGNIGAAAAARRRPMAMRFFSGRRRWRPTSRWRPPMRSTPSTVSNRSCCGNFGRGVLGLGGDAIQVGPGGDRLRQGQSRQANYYSVGIGSTSHLSTVLFMDVTGTKMQQPCPIAKMSRRHERSHLGPHGDQFRPDGALAKPRRIQDGKMRALAINGPARAKPLPSIPTLEEVGIKMGQESSWYGFFAPKGTPKPIIEKINKDLQTVIDMPDMRARELALGYRYIGGSPEQLAAYLKADIAKWEALDKKGAFK